MGEKREGEVVVAVGSGCKQKVCRAALVQGWWVRRIAGGGGEGLALWRHQALCRYSFDHHLLFFLQQMPLCSCLFLILGYFII